VTDLTVASVTDDQITVASRRHVNNQVPRLHHRYGTGYAGAWKDQQTTLILAFFFFNQ